MAVQITVEDCLIPYLVLIFNSLIFYLLRLNINSLSPDQFRLLLNEIISTVELCSDCAELGVVWEIHHSLGLGLTLFALCVWWSVVFGDAEACPCGPLEKWLLGGKSLLSNSDIQHKLIGQLIGAYLTWKYTGFIWCWHLSDQHQALHETKCESALFVSPLIGAGIECLTTFTSRLVALESENWNENLSIFANSLTTILLVFLSMSTTGGFFNPILATATILGCEGHSFFEHFTVYWLGSIIGSLLACWSHTNLISLHKKYD